MTNFIERPTRVGRSTLDRILPRQRTVWIRLALENGMKEIILNFWNLYYLSNGPSNLISLNLFNNADICYNNEQQALYNKASPRPLAFTQQWKQNFFLHLLNLSISTANLLKTESNLYKDIEPKIYQTQSNKLLFIVWYKQFGYLNFLALRKHLAYHNNCYTNNKHICDSYENTKTIKY